MAKRRGHGEGAIYQRKSDGRWCASVDLGFVQGKRRRKLLYGATRKEVGEKLKTILLEQQAGLNIAPHEQTVASFLAHWLEQSVRPHLRPMTYRSYEQVVRLYLVPHIGRHQLSKLAPEHVQRMVNTLRTSGGKKGQGLAARSVNYIRNVLRKALNQALKWGYVLRNVAQLVEVPRLERHTITPLSQEQARRLLEAVKGHRLEVLYRVALSFGLRRGEVLGLRWEDIDFAAQTLRVALAVQRQYGRLVLVPTKTTASARVLPLPPVLLALLRQHQANQQQERAVYGADWEEHGLVFPSTRGTPLEPRNLIRHFKAVLERVGLPSHIRFHDLRHSCATLLIAQGVHPRVVMEMLGHSQISVTMNTYGHVLPETQRQAARQLDELLGAADTDEVDGEEEDGVPSQDA
jgi:integrase